MKYSNDKKYEELKSVIKKKEFPIIVYGPPNTGKTYSIKKILRDLNIRYHEVDIINKFIKKPFDTSILILTYIFNVNDFDRILYKDNLIIETNLDFCNKLSGFTAIKFNKNIYKEHNSRIINTLKYKVNNYDEVLSINLYHFLGKIFYKKIKLTDISIEYDKIILYENKCQNFEINYNKTFKEKKSLSYQQQNNKKASTISRRNKVIESDEEDLIEDSKSSDSIYSTFNKLNNNAKMKLYLEKDCVKIKENYKSFTKNKIIAYIYENIHYFLDFTKLTSFYDILSLYSNNDNYLFAIIEYILENSQKPKKLVMFKSCDPNLLKFIN